VLIALPENDADIPRRVAALELGLQNLGWVKNKNIRIHYRFAETTTSLPTIARELVGLKPDVIVAGSGLVVSALRRETRAIPIVFVTAADPVGDGFVTSLARPEGNATGFTNSLKSMGGKWLELLLQIAPRVKRVAILYNPTTAPKGGAYFLPSFEAVAATLAVKPLAMPVRTQAEVKTALAGFGHAAAGGLVVMPDNFTSLHRRHIVEQAGLNRLPAIYPFRYFAEAGGLMSYGTDLLDLYRRTPLYVDRILKGTKLTDLPVQSPTKIELVINLKTARALDLTVPRIMLARADEVVD
jgi:putative ABC transport system substrate-binding protein